MTEEEKKAQREELLKSIEDQVKKVMADSQKENVSRKDLDDRLAEINKQIEEGLGNEEIKTLKESVDKMAKAQEELLKSVEKQGIALNKMQDTGVEKPERLKSFREMLRDSILEKKDIVLTEKNDDYGKRLSLKDYFTEKGNQQSPVFTLKNGTDLFVRKVAVDMLQSNIVQNNVANIRLTDLDPNRVGIPLTIYPHVLDILPSKRITKPYMSLLVVYDYEDGSGTKTEGSASGQSSFLLKTVEFKAYFLATWFTLSDETLDDLEEALDEISITAPDKIQDKIDTKILGTADGSSDVFGLLSTNGKTDFVPGDYIMPVGESANRVDVYSKMKLQCEGNKYIPDTIYLSPKDVDDLTGAKNAFDDSRLDRRVVYNNMGMPVMINGMRVVRSTAVSNNTAIVFDSRQTMIGVRRDMTMEIGYNGTDLTEGQKTVVLKVRVAFGVRDKAAIIYSSDVDAAVSTISQSA